MSLEELGAIAGQLRARAAPEAPKAAPGARQQQQVPRAGGELVRPEAARRMEEENPAIAGGALELPDAPTDVGFALQGTPGEVAARLQAQGAPGDVAAWMAGALEDVRERERDRAALVKRDWSDEAYEKGEAGNEATLERFEHELVGMLQRAGSLGLGDAEVLGSAIDLAGGYKKNYRLDHAEAVLLRCTRGAEEKSGPWMVKYLNHISQVRMKQRRDVEALEMMYEIESLAAFPLDEPGASEFYETLYRNMSASLRGLGREDEAAVYFSKAMDAARRHKPSMDWMDLWDLGVLIANRAFQSQRWTEFHRSREIIAEALRMQRVAEPHELVLRAKVLSNLGQCFLATAEHDEAEVHYSEAYALFDKTVGKRSPLFGMQAWACGNLRCAEGRHRDALPFLGEALFVEVVGDGLSVSEMAKLADQILMCLHELREPSSGVTEARTEPICRALATLPEDPRFWQLPETLELAVLCHKFSLILVTMRVADGHAAGRRYSERALKILQQQGGHDAKHWLAQAEMVHGSIYSGTAEKAIRR